MMSDQASRLVMFLYVLMRDEVTSGVVERIMEQHIEKAAGRPVKYSNPHVEAHARDVADRLLMPIDR